MSLPIVPLLSIFLAMLPTGVIRPAMPGPSLSSLYLRFPSPPAGSHSQVLNALFEVSLFSSSSGSGCRRSLPAFIEFFMASFGSADGSGPSFSAGVVNSSGSSLYYELLVVHGDDGIHAEGYRLDVLYYVLEGLLPSGPPRTLFKKTGDSLYVLGYVAQDGRNLSIYV